MSIKVKATVDRDKVKKIIAKKRKLLHQNIEAVIRNDAIPYLIALVMKGYDELSERMEGMQEDDPTNPANWREEFIELLREDFEDNFLYQDNKIIIRMGDKNILGYTGGEQDPGDDQPIHWLVFYLKGLVGEWAFISPGVYERITGRKYKPHWGKFGEGFMISRKAYYGKGWNRVMAFEEVRHPFSGFAPLDIFREAVNEFKLSTFVKRAVTATAEGRKI